MKQLLKTTKSKLRDAVGKSLQTSGLSSPNLWAKDKLTIVTFHRVLPTDLLAGYPIPDIAVTPDELDHFVKTLKQRYTIGTLHDMALVHKAGKRREKPLLAITFDDGQADNYLFARPVLQANDAKASFFVVSGAVESNDTLWHDRMAYAVQRAVHIKAAGLADWLQALKVSTGTLDLPNSAVAEAKKLTPKEREGRLQDLEALAGGRARPDWDGMMTWDQLRTLQAEGHEIGSHSVSHPILPLISDAALSDEIEGSRATLEQHLGREVHSFCYPNGDYDERVLNAVRSGGYHHAVSTRYGLNTARTEVLALRRIDLQGRFGRNAKGDFSSGALMLRMSGLLPGAT